MMMKPRNRLVALAMLLALPIALRAENPNGVVYQGKAGPGSGKHVVLIAGDHEYRTEETLPALARILAKHYGFKCTVLFTTDPSTGFITPGSSHISGMEALKTADLMVVGLRFQDFKQQQMQHFADYIDAGRPVVGLRTSTHAFKIRKDRPFAKYSFRYSGKEFSGGFGRHILGETWAGHYGRNHATSTRFLIEKDQTSHPILRGVKDVWVQSGAYQAYPIEGSRVLAKSQVLAGMSPKAKPQDGKQLMAAAWVRTYRSASGKSGRVFATTHGASEDILNEGFRRMLVNAHLWCLGMDDAIKADGNVSFVGGYNPVTFGFGGYRKGVKPADIEGWDKPILGAKK